ncbi:MAG: TlpA family protein disulfide reductase [Oscillospiraceae bacterium]|jgi:thiol-disulfide isomerase/thioredoxin|nr:TlpA family protein disulfide reductase [Oscillospiraceae bacterium]
MRKFYQMIFGVLVLPALLLSGCTGGTDGKTVETDPGAEAVSSPPVQEETPSEEESSAIFVTFEGTDLEGNTVSEDVFTQSKLTMVNVWATYCNPCLREMPGLGELAAEYDGSEFQIIGIVSDVREGEDQALVESLVQQTGANYPHLLLNDSINNAFMGSVSGVPTTFFFDGEGMYLGGVVGSAEKSEWEELIHGLLEES